MQPRPKSHRPMELLKSKFRRLDSGIRLLRAGLLLCFDALILSTHRTKSPRCEAAIFCLHGLGDLLLAGNTIESLTAHFRSQGLRVVLFVQPSHAELARHNFNVDSVETIDRHCFTRQLGHRSAILKAVANRFRVAVQPCFNRMFRVEDCLMRATGALEKIGNAGHPPFINSSERWCGDRFYTKLVEPRAALMHELERYSEFIAGLGLSSSCTPWQLKQNGDSFDHRLLPQTPYLVVAPHASDTRRSWPLENFAQTARQIARQHHLAVVLVGDKKNDASWPNGDADIKVIDLRGQISTENLPAVLSRSELILSNDSGTYHIGVSLNRPTVAVGGSGLPVRYFPYPQESKLPTRVIYRPVPCANCNWHCIHTRSRSETAWCLQQVPWQEVAEAVNQLLRQRS